MKQRSIAVIAALPLAGLLLALIYVGCAMDVAEPEVRIALVDPYITLHPESKVYTANAAAVEALTVEAEAWTAADGKLSYQWYTFDTIADYLNNEGNGAAIPGETGKTLDIGSLPNLVKTAGAKNYFYAEITNTNSAATDRQKAVTRSDVAIISFYTEGTTPPPVIRRQPREAGARFGRSINPLSIRVQTAPAAELSYQWYKVVFENGEVKADQNGFPLGEKLVSEVIETDPATWTDPNEPEYETIYETGAEYQPVPGLVPVGDNYFYVVITSTDASGEATETSVPTNVKIDYGLRADAPVITTQPKAALYFSGGTAAVATLTVAATSPDYGDLTYQWYRQPGTTPSNKGGTPIAGETTASYTPDLDANPNAFYYAVVTNTNNNVLGSKTAATTTHAVSVRLTTASNVANPNSTITLGSLTDSANRYNYVRGYGGMEVAWANFPETFPEDTELQYDPDRLGYNILRIMLPVSNTNIDLAMDDLVNITRRRPHYYTNVKIVNKYGGYVAAAPWSPPKEWKSNNSINGGGKLRPAYYQQYAAYLRSFAQHMYNRGAPIYVISIQNEPNYTAGYDGCEWDPADMMRFFVQAGQFTQGVKGWGGGKQTSRVLTMNGESANHVDINYDAIDNPNAYKNIDVFARHVYGERDQNLWTTRPNVQKVDGKEVWMTEHNINSANAAGYVLDSKWDYIWRFLNDVDLVMRQNNENAFVWWASKRFYSMVGDGQYGTPAGVALPRGWALSHYSKFTIDMTRIGFDMTGSAVGGGAISITGDSRSSTVVNGTVDDMDNISARVTAYVSQDGSEISMVMWTPTLTSGERGYNLGDIAIKMPVGFTIGSATGVVSYLGPPPQGSDEPEPVFHQPFDVGVSADRLTAYVNLPRSRIISVKFTKQ